MTIHTAVIQFLQLPDQDVLDERIFFNVLKDLNAFADVPASQNVVRAFVSKGYLRDIWTGKNGWQQKAQHYLVHYQGFQENIVVYVLRELALGFKNYTPQKERCVLSPKEPSIPAATQKFTRYEPEAINRDHPLKPDSLRVYKGDIVMVKNGVAIVSSVQNDYIEVIYIKKGSDGKTRKIYYDETIEVIIKPSNNCFIKSAKTGQVFYIRQSFVDKESARFVGTYADRINAVTLIPYTIRLKQFQPCNEQEFIYRCCDLAAFENFRSQPLL